MGLLSRKNDDHSDDDDGRGEGEEQYSFRSGSGQRLSARAVDRERRAQNPDGFRRLRPMVTR